MLKSEMKPDDNNALRSHELVVINFKFWILMLLATTIGEIVGNFISRDLKLGYEVGSIILVSLFFSTVFATLYFRKQHYLFFWILIALGNVAGTDIADFITRNLELGNLYGSLFVLTVLSGILALFYFLKTRKMTHWHSLRGRSLEVLYWLAILSSSTFGTTSGDFLSSDTPLGSAGGTVMLILMLISLGILVEKTAFSRVLAYWLAIVVVHPIGATFGNYISKPEGLNLGNVVTSISLIFAFGFYLYSPKLAVIKRKP
jgi:uncharacterized membrane-anchored protein